MSKKLKVRELERNNLPYGLYNWIITLQRASADPYRSKGNGAGIQEVRQLLRNSASGKYRIKYNKNYRENRVYTSIMLTDSMDVALVKLCHRDQIDKIYKVKVI